MQRLRVLPADCLLEVRLVDRSMVIHGDPDSAHFLSSELMKTFATTICGVEAVCQAVSLIEDFPISISPQGFNDNQRCDTSTGWVEFPINRIDHGKN